LKHDHSHPIPHPDRLLLERAPHHPTTRNPPHPPPDHWEHIPHRLPPPPLRLSSSPSDSADSAVSGSVSASTSVSVAVCFFVVVVAVVVVDDVSSVDIVVVVVRLSLRQCPFFLLKDGREVREPWT